MDSDYIECPKMYLTYKLCDTKKDLKENKKGKSIFRRYAFI